LAHRTNCHKSSEFLSSDVESLMEEIAAARHFAPTQALVQVYGVCDECRTGKKSPTLDGTTTELVFARDALRITDRCHLAECAGGRANLDRLPVAIEHQH
jgi:hypothetical protein